MFIRMPLALAAAAACTLLAGCSSPAPQATAGRNSPYGQEGIHVSGTATVRAEPDLAIVTLGCSTRAQRAAAAKSSNDRAMAAVLRAIQAHGVAHKDVQTVVYGLERDYESSGPKGFQVDNMVQVNVRDVPRALDIVSAATDAGANQIESVRFEVENLHELRSKAREKAIQAAREKAEQLAHDAGVRLGKVVAIQDGAVPSAAPGYGQTRNSNYESKAPTTQNDETPDDRIASGMVSVEVQEEVTFAIE